MTDWQQLMGAPDDEDALIQPKPRNPPKRSFSALKTGKIRLDSDQYVRLLKTSPRYGSEDYSLDPPAPPPPWTDEELFYEWLMEQKLPAELAEMLYLGTPEISFLAGRGYMNGVEAPIDENSDLGKQNIRGAGFFIVGSGSNGDELVIDVAYRQTGEVGYFPLETMWDKTPDELQMMFIPVSASIGEYLRLIDDEGSTEIPGDYWSAKEKHDQGIL